MAELTKAQERDLFDATLAQLPDGYIRDMLTEARPIIFGLMALDIGCGLGEALDQRRELAAEIAQLQTRAAELNAAAQNSQRQIDRAAARLESLKSEARVIAHQLQTVC
jgi:hypothetical protein